MTSAAWAIYVLGWVGAIALALWVHALTRKLARTRDEAGLLRLELESVRSATERAVARSEAETDAASRASAASDGLLSQVALVGDGLAAVVTQVRETSTTVADAAEADRAVAARIDELERAVGEASTMVEMMTASVMSIAATAENLADLAQQVTGQAVGGGQLLDETAATLSAVSERTRESSTVIERLAQRSRDIGSIVRVIEDIADQTNLLALNAAIEAARAGDAGRGFAVVSDEIRKLAERSVTATREIEQVIEAAQADSTAAVAVARSNIADIRAGATQVLGTSQTLQTIIASVEQVGGQVGEVRQATQEQSFAAGEVMRLVEDMTSMTQTVARSTREQAEQARQVAAASRRIVEMTENISAATVEQRRAGEETRLAVVRVSRDSQACRDAVLDTAARTRRACEHAGALLELLATRGGNGSRVLDTLAGDNALAAAGTPRSQEGPHGSR